MPSPFDTDKETKSDPVEVIARMENLCRLICQNAVEEETSTHVAVSWDEGTAARILNQATRLRQMISDHRAAEAAGLVMVRREVLEPFVKWSAHQLENVLPAKIARDGGTPVLGDHWGGEPEVTVGNMRELVAMIEAASLTEKDKRSTEDIIAEIAEDSVLPTEPSLGAVFVKRSNAHGEG